MLAITVCTPVKKNFPTAQLFSNPPPPPPWSKNFMKMESAPCLSMESLTTPATSSTASSHEVGLRSRLRYTSGWWRRFAVGLSGA